MPARYSGDLVEIDDTSPSTSFVTAPDVMMMATIPYVGVLSPGSRMPHAYATSKYETGQGPISTAFVHLAAGGAFTRLFETGDRIGPRASYTGYPDLLTSFTCDVFRAAMWITDVRVYHDDQKREVGASYRWKARVGYTPVGPSAVHPSLPFARHRLCFRGVSGQVGPNGPRPDLRRAASGGYAITMQYEFKVCEFLDRAQSLFTRYRAPWAWMRFEYDVELDPAGGGRYGLRHEGSYIPTQIPYVDLGASNSHAHDMMGNSQGDIDRFVEAGACITAPGRPPSTPFGGTF